MIEQEQIDRVRFQAKVATVARRNLAVEEFAAVMFSLGYRAEELIIHHHPGEIQILLSRSNCGSLRFDTTDSTRIHLGARQPIPQTVLRIRRWWRRYFPYKEAQMCRIERKVIHG
jgi:hypothetical protein